MNSSVRKPSSARRGIRAAIAIVCVFAVLALVAVGLLVGLKATERQPSLMKSAEKEKAQ